MLRESCTQDKRCVYDDVDDDSLLDYRQNSQYLSE